MDWTLLAVTALGFVGVYLMLPRRRGSLVKLGALLGTLGLAGLFLYLAGLATPGQDLPPMPFYLFAAIMIGGSVGVICHPKPVYAALYFVLVTLAGAGVFVLLMAEFMAIVLVIVYAGAILVTYVFVIMLASQGGGGPRATTPDYDRIAAEPFLAVLVSFILLGTVLQVAYPKPGRAFEPTLPASGDPLMQEHLGLGYRAVRDAAAANLQAFLKAQQQYQADTGSTAPAPFSDIEPAKKDALPRATIKPTNIQVLGVTLYGRYLYSLELAGILLTIALVGAVMISRKNVEGPSGIGTGKVPTE